MPRNVDDAKVRAADALFKKGELLDLDQRTEILNGIDLVFKNKLMKNGVPLPHFGTTDKDFVVAMAEL